ncbi:MAG: histidinol phosphate phosphatase domain-containing protein [Candidatus Omnitrophota bacterium]|jgi:histidinol phosphatase-like PHP family hydrolase
MYNLHTHTLLSDGVLLPSEVAVRYLDKGYKVIAITDHADYCNIKPLINAVTAFCSHWPKNSGITVLPGIELTHIPPEQFKPLAKYARKNGIKVIVAHGETTMEPVITGTNRAAIMSDIDILAHPGLINDGDTLLAKERNIFLELTSRRGHSDTNNHVAKQALKHGVKLILNNDSHEPQDIITPEELAEIGTNSGVSKEGIDIIYRNIEEFIKRRKG